MDIKSVGYVGFGAPDPKAWLDFGVNVIGMMPARAVPGESWGMPGSGEAPKSAYSGIAEDGSAYLKMDERQWRVGIHPDKGNPGIRYLGLEVAGPIELEAAVRELRAHGIEVREGSKAEASQRAVTEIAFLKDPDGVSLELFHGPVVDYKFDSPVDNQKFVAGHTGFGHANLFVSNLEKSYEFYTRQLGFRLSDYMSYGEGSGLKFLHCNQRHHSVALVGFNGVTGLQHLMFEVRSIDDVGRALDRAKKAGVQVTSSLGRHRNDNALSFYMRGPSGFDVEVGCDCLKIDETWRANEFCEGDVWGHDGLIEAVISSAQTIAGSRGPGG